MRPTLRFKICKVVTNAVNINDKPKYYKCMNKKIHVQVKLSFVSDLCKKLDLLTIVIYMKLTMFISLLFTIPTFATTVVGQTVTLQVNNVSLKSVLIDLRKQSKYSFIVKNELLNKAKPISVSIDNKSVIQSLTLILEDQPFDYEVNGKVITLIPKRDIPRIESINKIEDVKEGQLEAVEGRVIDNKGKPIQGSSVRIVGKNIGTRTDVKGEFKINAAIGDVIEITFVGYQSVRVPFEKATSRTAFKSIVLKVLQSDISEVVVTGTGIDRSKQTFTGATSSFTGEELKMVNNQNIIASLRALDPSFIQVENNLQGSNPNALPTIELRGQTSISTEKLRDEYASDPNLPLFVLDGFESNLRTITDLDMNIVASVTILKDAASTAIYGSRASNGVVVVETIKPIAGKINLTYTSDLNLQAPDLGSYNMMNATEKLEFERLSGRYASSIGSDFSRQQMLDGLYNDRLKNVLRGVDTYWMDKPLQTGYSHRHSVNARGGQGALVFTAGFNFKDTKGVMIGSGRQDYGGNVSFGYRAGSLNITNNTTIGGSKSDESPYGSYSTWVNTNPYFEMVDANQMYLSETMAMDGQGNIRVDNPYYNSSLNSFNKGNAFNFSNNIQLTYQFNPNFKLTTSGQIRKNFNNTDIFKSPLMSEYQFVEGRKKGRLTHNDSKGGGYTVNMMLTYAKVFAEKHSLTANFRTEFSENRNKGYGFTAEGFPTASNGNPAFSYGFLTDSRPSSSTTVTRRNSMVYSMNYSYDQRFNADFNFNMDGSTAFGSNNLYSPYYSGGVSWNLSREQFLKNADWIDILRVRGNIGVTGNQSFGNVSQSVFEYSSELNRFGQGMNLSALGAPDLEWQRTRQISVGMDLGFMKRRANVQLNAYDKYTDPMVIAVTLPSSTGLQSFPYNLGASTTKGVEANISFSPIYRPQEQVLWTLGITGSILDIKYSGFDNALRYMNENLQRQKSLTRFKDGHSPRDIWAVPSLGIDPATGRELLLTVDGRQTFDYNSDDIVKVGSSQPWAEGVFRTNVSYKGFTANMMFRYIWHRDNMNNALFEKVENISRTNIEKNQDKRAYYERWKQPGDISQFKAISITSSTPMSSRFIQTENTISAESISIGYIFRNKSWLNTARLASLGVSGFANDLFYISTVRRERGIDYPFARSGSISLVATFK